MRPEFLQAMLRLVHANDALFILDEVQTGVGTTGTAWAYQQLGIQPDVVAFSKKAQVGGIMAGGRVDEVPDNVFNVSGRINSTWGGGLVDMVRSQRALEIIESEGLIEQAGPKGQQLVAGLERLRDDSGLISNVRGRGLFVAFDLESRDERDAVVTDLRVEERVIVLPCGDRSIRFRPALSVSQDEIDEALGATCRSVVRIASKELQYS
jgi:L-lysine 6-transaminase